MAEKETGFRFDSPLLEDLWTRLCLRRVVFNTMHPPQLILDWIYHISDVDRAALEGAVSIWRTHSGHRPTQKVRCAVFLSLRGGNVSARKFALEAAVASYDPSSFSYESPESHALVQGEIFSRIDAIVKAFDQLGLAALRLPIMEEDYLLTLEIFEGARGKGDPQYKAVEDWCRWHSGAQLDRKIAQLTDFLERTRWSES